MSTASPRSDARHTGKDNPLQPPRPALVADSLVMGVDPGTAEGLTGVIARHRPAVLAVEGVFYSKNVRTSVVLGHARGAVLLAAALHEVQVAEYPPAEVKSAVVGHGAATKDQVGFMVQRLLRLTEPPKPHDAADGVAVALCHCFRGFGPGARQPINLKLRLFDQGKS